MKNLILVVAAVFVFMSCSDKSQFTINGEIVPAPENNVIMFSIEGGEPVAKDTVDASSGSFIFSGDVSLPELRLIGFENSKGYIGQLFVEPGQIDMTIYPDSFQNNVVNGSAANDLFQVYMDEVVKFSESLTGLQQRFMQAQASGNQEEMSSLQFEYETMLDNTQLYAKNFIKENNESPVAAYVYMMNFVQSAELEELDSMVTVFEPIKESDFVVAISDRAEALRVSGVGAVAPDFTLKGVDGTEFSLSDYRGKYVLIDFWASWCQPCMNELPNVIEQYKKYNEKGFEIVGVSLDRNRDAWASTIEEKGMNWVNGWDREDADAQGAVADKYGVAGIPHTVLIDTEGKIMAKNLRGAELEAKLAEILN